MGLVGSLVKPLLSWLRLIGLLDSLQERDSLLSVLECFDGIVFVLIHEVFQVKPPFAQLAVDERNLLVGRFPVSVGSRSNRVSCVCRIWVRLFWFGFLELRSLGGFEISFVYLQTDTEASHALRQSALDGIVDVSSIDFVHGH